MSRPTEPTRATVAIADVLVKPALVAALEKRMEIVIAIELIAGAVFILVFWYRNPALLLSRRLSQQLSDLYDDEDNDDARVPPSNLLQRSQSGWADSLNYMDPRQ
jgi:hypothetical protein